jgi:hypothetical protein
MPGDQLIPAFLTGTCDDRHQDAVLGDAIGGLQHGFIICNFKGMILKWMQLRQRNIDDFFLKSFDPGFFSLKYLIVGGQI